MKRLSFIEAVLAALALSTVGAVLFQILMPVFGVTLVARGLGLLLALAYVMFLLARSRITRGRLTLLTLWMLAALAITLLCPSLFSMAAAHLTLVWLSRSLLMHGSVLAATGDLLISAVSLAAGCWAFAETASVFASVWTVGLLQAACSLLPSRETPRTQHHAEHSFNHAARAAEQALRAYRGAP